MMVDGAFTNIRLRCCDCKHEFVFEIDEQEFFASLGLANKPKRCSKCRLLVRLRRSVKDIAAFSELICAQ